MLIPGLYNRERPWNTLIHVAVLLGWFDIQVKPMEKTPRLFITAALRIRGHWRERRGLRRGFVGDLWGSGI